jgi:hypothetical protein
MTNVVPFRKANPPSLHCFFLQTLVDPNTPLEEGDLVAGQFVPGKEVMFSYWLGPTGRDCDGRFIKKGSPHEATRLDWMKYTEDSLRRGGVSKYWARFA